MQNSCANIPNWAPTIRVYRFTYHSVNNRASKNVNRQLTSKSDHTKKKQSLQQIQRAAAYYYYHHASGAKFRPGPNRSCLDMHYHRESNRSAFHPPTKRVNPVTSRFSQQANETKHMCVTSGWVGWYIFYFHFIPQLSSPILQYLYVYSVHEANRVEKRIHFE